MTIFHLRDLAACKRQIIKCDDVKYINIPYFEGLSIDEILEFAADAGNGDALRALPEPRKEIEKLPREYLGNVVYTIVGTPFQHWVNKRITDRNEKVIKDQNLAIQMDPEIAQLFKNSTSVSVSKGISGNLMKLTAKVSSFIILSSYS